jgi:hypothetical protein
MSRHGARGSCVNKALHQHILSVDRLQFVARKHLHAALCSAGYAVSAAARKSPQSAVRWWYRNTPEECPNEAIWKVSRRWRRYITFEGNILSQQWFGIQTKVEFAL